MKYCIALLLPCLFIMCKSKEIIPEGETFVLYVMLKDGVSPKDIKGDISPEVSKYDKVGSDVNQWLFNYLKENSDEKKIKAELLNHPLVISVFDKEQFARIKAKKESGGPSGSLGKKAMKQ